MREVACSAPGKMLLIGGYSVLDKPNVAYTVPINKRVYARIRDQEEDGITFSLPQFKITAVGKVDEGRIGLGYVPPNTERTLSYVKNAADISMSYLYQKGKDVGNIRLTTLNDSGFTYHWGASKSGFGSSAGSVTATAAAIFAFAGRDVVSERQTINKIAQTAHFLAQGKVGSGFDVSTCAFGAHVYRKYSPEILKNLPQEFDVVDLIDKDWDYYVDPLEFPNFETAVAFTGKAASTKDMIAKINEWKLKDLAGYKALIGDINEANQMAIVNLEYIQKEGRSHIESTYDVLQFKRYFDEGRALTKKLGELSGAPIETDEMSRMVDAAIDAGALTAKLPGAGGGDSIVALCLDKESKENVQDMWSGMGLTVLKDVEISKGDAGVSQDDPKFFHNLADELGLVKPGYKDEQSI